MMGVKVKIDMNTNKKVLKMMMMMMMMMMTVMTEHDSVATMVVMGMAGGLVRAKDVGVGPSALMSMTC